MSCYSFWVGKKEKMIRNKNKGELKDGCTVEVCFAEDNGIMVYSYSAIYRNGWFDHGGSNNRHDTPATINGCYSWYEVVCPPPPDPEYYI